MPLAVLEILMNYFVNIFLRNLSEMFWSKIIPIDFLLRNRYEFKSDQSYGIRFSFSKKYNDRYVSLDIKQGVRRIFLNIHAG